MEQYLSLSLRRLPGPCEISFSEISSSGQGSTGRISWMDFSPTGILLATLSESFSAVVFDDQTLAIYSTKGRRRSTMQLSSAIYRLESYKDFLVVITVDGLLYRWNVASDQELQRPVSILALLSKGKVGRLPRDDIIQLWVHSNGLPVIVTQSEKAFTLDIRKSIWVLIATGWFADCSPIWEGRTRNRSEL
jgi:WD40 repeat protein